MKKKAVLVLALISIIALVFGTAAAPMAGKKVSFVESRFISGKGAVFIFEVSGVTKADLKNAFSPVGNVSCNFKDDGRVACTVKYAKQYVGQSIPLTLAGYAFYVEVPQDAHPCTGAYLEFDYGGQVFVPYGHDLGGIVVTPEWMQYYINENVPTGYITGYNTCLTGNIEYRWFTP